MCITDAGNAILAPSVGPGPCVIVGEVLWRRKNMSVCCYHSTQKNSIWLAILGTPDFPDCGGEDPGRGRVTHGSRHHHRDCNPLALQWHYISPPILMFFFTSMVFPSHDNRVGQTCSPLSLGKIRAPLLPVLGAMTVFLQPLLLRGQELMVIEDDHDRFGSSGLENLCWKAENGCADKTIEY